MKEKENKITIRQLIIMFIMTALPSVIRIIPTVTAEISKQASWVTNIVVSIVTIPYLYILFKLLNMGKDMSLEDAYQKIIGKVASKILVVIYVIWIFVVASLNLRYFAERFASSILIEAPLDFFIVTLLIIVYMISRKNIEYFARFNEIFIIFFSFFIIGILTVPLTDVKLTNLLPVTTMDIIPILKSLYSELGLISYITFLAFLGDKISDKENMQKHIIRLPIVILIINTALILSTIGIFGAKATVAFSMPFFIFLKNISQFVIIERTESIFISLWIATDFTIIVSFIYILTKLNKKIFSLKCRKELVTPMTFGIYVFSQYVANNVFELKEFSEEIGLYINIILGIAVPIIIYIIGKIRKLV